MGGGREGRGGGAGYREGVDTETSKVGAGSLSFCDLPWGEDCTLLLKLAYSRRARRGPPRPPGGGPADWVRVRCKHTCLRQVGCTAPGSIAPLSRRRLSCVHIGASTGGPGGALWPSTAGLGFCRGGGGGHLFPYRLVVSRRGLAWGGAGGTAGACWGGLREGVPLHAFG